ncbi:hypothetical protein GTP91_07830 [Rugamonas sp. FT82W]|uniref:Uncharacterized protein n=1 Tax=Duganella vulcania TaxID=2692166 RepID=A0A845G2G5_9BURK|nr:hypothetical protein [Duganella vulcania]MYM87089.1 hypothetical protein [Duganella vulcania]
MKKSILEIYALAVCFVTVVCFVVALGIATYSVLEIAKPDFTLSSWQYNQHQTNEAFWNGCGTNRYCGSEEKQKDRPSEADLTKKRRESYERILVSEQRDGFQALVKCLIIMLIDLVVFGFHWVLARRARSPSSN